MKKINSDIIYIGFLSFILSAIYYHSGIFNTFFGEDASEIMNARSLKDVLGFFVSKYKAMITGFLYWRPVPNISFSIDYKLYGKEPFGYYITNLILHILCVFTLTKLLMRNVRLPRILIYIIGIVAGISLSATMLITRITARYALFSALFLLLACFQTRLRFLFSALAFFIEGRFFHFAFSFSTRFSRFPKVIF